ncbi:LysR substrate-binding domain-containing protein [Granulosicoccus sp. 3-233]|uniref:LysR substrate-binding domain-containing protein n=1 Tax=Granulosicoccus sp. 3-233 TaxID=3417969 RepID=UPI003D356654
MQMNLDTELLQTLVAIVDSGSFKAAARNVHRTQSAVSMQMKRLEEIVEQPLFEKHGRRSVLTLHGQNLLLYARRILSLQQEALATFRSPEIHGEVRIGVCDDYVLSFMPSIFASFAKSFPNVFIRLDSQPSTRLIESTKAGDLDFSLVNVLHGDTDYEILRSDPLVWVTSRNHATHEVSPLPLAVESNCLWGRWAQKVLNEENRLYRVGYSTFNIAGIVAIIEAGLAVSVMSRTSVPPQLRILQAADGFPELPHTQIGLVLSSGDLSAAAQSLAGAVRQSMTATSIAA